MAELTALENDELRVDVTVEPGLRISVLDKRNQFTWACPGAPFELFYWDAAHFTERRCPADHELGWEFRLLPEENHLAVQCTWPRGACGFRAVLWIDGPALQFLLPGRRLVENRPFDIRTMALDVLPGFGGARTGEQGFLFLPYDLGMICRFNRTGEHETPLLIYGGGERGITAPVFGTARAEAGYLGVLSQGEFDAALVVSASRGPEHDLHSVHPRLRTRFHPADALVDVDFRVHYLFLTGKAVSPAGMARAYRRYLTEDCNLPNLRQRAEDLPVLEYARTAPTLHVHLAEKRRKTRMTGDGELRVRTNLTDVPGMVRQIREAGIEQAVMVLVGWNCEGRDGLYPTRFPVESAVGGADAMSAALAGIRTVGFRPGALDNFTDMYRRSPAFNENFCARQLGGEAWRGGIWAGGHAYVICPQQALERHAQRDMRRLRDLGLAGLLVLDRCPGPGVLKCYHEEHPLTRSDWAQHVRQLISLAESTFGLCRVSGPTLFSALAAGTCMCPVRGTPSGDTLDQEWFADEPFPFLPLALHGTVLLAAEADEDPLRVVEYGAAPVFNTTKDGLLEHLPSLVELSRRYTAELAPMADEFIDSYDTPADGLVTVGYSGGARVLINRTGEPAEIDGVEIAPNNFQVQR